MNDAEVTIVIPTKDNPVYLANCLSSIYRLTDDISYRVLLVDSGSTHLQTYEVAEYFSSRYSLEYVQFNQQGSFNFSALVNHGVSMSSTRLICLLNDDTEVLHKSWLKRLAGAVSNWHSEVVGCTLLYDDWTIQHAGISPDEAHVTSHSRRGQRFLAESDLIGGKSHDVWAATGACLMVDREAYWRVGGFDESFAVSFNDIDYCLRQSQNGGKIALADDVVLLHFESKSRGFDVENKEKTRRHQREAELFRQKWGAAIPASSQLS